MNVNTAQQIAAHIAKMAAITATFSAEFGAEYQLTEHSPERAWDLHHHFMAEQASIANLLDSKAIANPFFRYERWWERRPMMNIALVNELASTAMRLVENTAYLTAKEALHAEAPSIRTIQESIAGMLHPVTRQKGLSNQQA